MAEDWDSAENYSCFTPKGDTPIDIPTVDRQKIYEEEKARADAQERIRKEQATESGKKIGKGCLVVAAILVVLAIIIGIIAIVAAPEEQPSQIQLPLTSAERAYATTIVSQATTVSNAFTELGKLLQNPQIGNEDWTLKMATQLAIIRTAYNKAMEIEPPDSMTHIHYKYVQAMKHYNTATELVAQGIDEMNPDLVNKATTEIQTGTQLINEVTELILEFKETHK